MDTSKIKSTNSTLRAAIKMCQFGKGFEFTSTFGCDKEEVNEFMDFLDTLSSSQRKRITAKIIPGGLKVRMKA